MSRAVYDIALSLRVQYDILRGTIFTNIHAITLLLYSNTYFMPNAFLYKYCVFYLITYMVLYSIIKPYNSFFVINRHIERSI